MVTLFLPWLLPWSSTLVSLLQKVLHAQGLTLLWLFSAAYHTFMNVDSIGREGYRRLLAVDVFGVWMAQAMGERISLSLSLSRDSLA